MLWVRGNAALIFIWRSFPFAAFILKGEDASSFKGSCFTLEMQQVECLPSCLMLSFPFQTM
jgi:hypothetical protein